MKKYVIIWDWDNTLADTKKAVLEGIKDVARHFNLPDITEADLKNVMTEHRGKFWQRSFGDDLMVGINYYIAAYPKYAHLVELFDATVQTLDYIQERKIPQIILKPIKIWNAKWVNPALLRTLLASSVRMKSEGENPHLNLPDMH